jgi:glycosyltransferase involved in cell wall biosynthesis
MKKVSIIVPCYNEDVALPIFYGELRKQTELLSDYMFEIIIVDDGSKDNTLSVMKELAEKDERVKYISFSRNFGKEAAMYAGFSNASGDYVAVMDADMQDPPYLLEEMLEILEKGEYDSVATRRVTRKGEPKIRSFFARMFYKIINKFSEADIVDGARDFRLMKREMVEAILAMGDSNRFSKGIFGWIGFRTYWMPYENVERVAGQSKWNFWGLCSYALDGIVNFSQVPLDIASWFGILMTVVSFLAILFIIVRKLLFGGPVAGWASTACIITFIGGIQLLCLGIIGKYLATVYLEVKKRPHYIISESNSEDVKRIG